VDPSSQQPDVSWLQPIPDAMVTAESVVVLTKTGTGIRRSPGSLTRLCWPGSACRLST